MATFVFCSVPNPVLGLRELKRVVKPGGQILLLEHVRSGLPILGTLVDRFDPWVAPWTGVHINRRTVENVKKAGLDLEQVVDFGRADIFKRIHARKTAGGSKTGLD